MKENLAGALTESVKPLVWAIYKAPFRVLEEDFTESWARAIVTRIAPFIDATYAQELTAELASEKAEKDKLMYFIFGLCTTDVNPILNCKTIFEAQELGKHTGEEVEGGLAAEKAKTERLNDKLRRIRLFLVDHLSEVKNNIGGVIGYELHLNDEQVQGLFDNDLAKQSLAESGEHLNGK